MPEFRKVSTFPIPAHALWAFHAHPGAFSRLAPPWQSLRLASWTGSIRDGGRLEFDLLPLGRRVPLAVRWVAHHEGFVDGREFCDRQLKGPFAHWLHRHTVTPGGQSPVGSRGVAHDLQSTLCDDIDYRLPAPLAALGVPGWLLRRDLDRMFAFRHERTLNDARRHLAFADRPRLRLLLTGSSGFIGTPLAAYLSNAGHTVDRLVRREPRPVIDGTGREIALDAALFADEPADSADFRAALASVADADAGGATVYDAVIHLGGAPIAANRWTEPYKRHIADSRVRSTLGLSRLLAAMPTPPSAFLIASGVSGYTPTGSAAPADESAPLGAGFLADVTRAWEAAADPARAAGIRVCHLRLGAVLGAQGQTLASMRAPFVLGLGASIAPGTQRVAWISLDDTLAAVEFLLHHLAHPLPGGTAAANALTGPVNLVAPAAVSFDHLADTLARVLRRPRLLKLPVGVLRAMMGQLADEATRDLPVAPAKLAAAGFRFDFADLEAALRMELGALDA